jgi:hypothetical protein
MRARAAAHVRAGRFAAAEAELRAALASAPADPRTRVLLAETLLSQGRYAEAWPLTDARLDAPELGSPRPPLEQPEWRGEDLQGKRLLIVGEQGAGDQIMYARFAPILQARGADATLLCAAALARLFQASLGVKVFAMAGRVEMPDPDLWVLSASLPARLGVTPRTVPSAPYLSARPGPRPGARIGVMTRGHPRHPNDASRSLPPRAAERLLGLAGAIDLSPAATGAADFLETAEIIAGLQVVVSVDTSVAHLAGALGKPVLILLPAHGLDWRWMEGRTDSPWYPSATLLRQRSAGDWGPVLDEVERRLA